MSRKLLCAVLSAFMLMSSFGFTAFSEEAQLSADWTSTVMTAKNNNFAYETKNYSSEENGWDSENGYFYVRHISTSKNNADNLSVGNGSNVFYIGRWSLGPIPLTGCSGKVYIAMLVRTNSASTPQYLPMTLKPDGETISVHSAEKAFSGNGEWEFNTVDVTFAQTTESFNHGQLRFGTESGKYMDIAAWGIFPSSYAKSSAEADLKNASKCTDEQVKTVKIADRNGDVIKTHNLLKGAVTLPDYDDTKDSSFAGWTDTKGSYTVIAQGGAEYTPSGDITLYPVWADFVRFVDETASTNGNGMSADSPYNSFAKAASDLAESGGTIVITGTKDAEGDEAETADITAFSALSNTGDIVVTSVYDGIDYRTNGAKLLLKGIYFGYDENPGRITFDNIDIVSSSWNNWHLHGHPFEITDTCTVKDENGGNISNIQILAIAGGQNRKEVPAVHNSPIDITIGNGNCTSIILGPRQELEIKDVNITVNGSLSTISVSNNSYEGSDWAGVADKFGQLTVDGDVKIAVNGSLGNVNARFSYENDYYGIKSINGNVALIVNHGGKFTGNMSDPVKNATKGKWYILKAAEGANLAYGESADEVLLELADGLDYNFANLTNTENSKNYSFFIENGETVITIPESGNYTMTLSKNESKTVTFVDADGGNTVDPIKTISGLTAVLPKLENTDILVFMGWTDEENGKTVKYEGGASYTVTDNITLYAVWEEAETYTVTFMADGKEFDIFTGIEGKTVVYPAAYPEKNGYYFKKWDKIIDKIGTEDMTVNAEFVKRDDVGYIYYWNGEAETDGDGSYNRPFKLMASMMSAVSKTGGTVVLTGRCETIYSPRATNTADIYFTSLDPVTGVDYRGEFKNGQWQGACFYMPTGTYWGGVQGVPGKLSFDNVDIVNVYGQYGINHWTFDAHPIEIGENVRHLSAESGAEIEWFIGATSSNASNPHHIKVVFKRGILGANWLARGGGEYTIDSVDYVFSGKSYLRYAHDSTDKITFNGPLKFTFIGNCKDSRIYPGKATYKFGAKAYASFILNDGTTIINEMDVSAETGLDGRMYVINSPVGGTVLHAETKGEYSVTSEEYNFAELLDSDGNTVDSVIVVGDAVLKAPDYGTYNVRYSNKNLYRIDYETAPYNELCPDSYAVSAEDTDKHTIILPVLENQNAHKFLGWTTTENGTSVEFDGGDEYTLSGTVRMYAVWEEIPTCTVTFKNDDGEVIHEVTGFVGMKLTFPEENPFKYGEKLLGYAFEGTTDILGKDAVIPDADKTALPVWGTFPDGETRVYVDGTNGNNDNSGISPDKAVATIAKAVEMLREKGGYIIVCGGANTLEGGWHNKGDITLTSYDEITGINYKAETLSEDKLAWKSGAYIMHKPIAFGYNEITGKITLENITLGSSADYTYLNFSGHPYEIGTGISYFRKDSDTAQIALDQRMFSRSLGEVDAKRMNPEGLVMTFNTVNSKYVPHILGKAELDIPRVEITVNTPFLGNLYFANDSGGGKATVTGDVFITLNANAKGFTFGQNTTNPIKGNIYVIYNNSSEGNISSLMQAEGYGKYTVKTSDEAVISHGENAGSFTVTLADGKTYGYAKLIDSEKNIAGFITLDDGSAEFTLPYADNFTLEYTDTALYRIAFETGDEAITVPESWYESGTEVELPTELYRYGYKHTGWKDGETLYNKGIITMPEKNVTLTAVWENAPKYTVTFDANGADIDVPASASEYHGENIVLEKISCADGTFVGWNENKDALDGKLNHVITEDTTLYAIVTKEPVYVINSYFRGDPNDYTGKKCQFRRYVIDVYLENANVSSGSFKLNTDNKFLYYLGHIPQKGITATVTAPVSTGTVAGVPGLQYSTTKTIEFSWQSETALDTSGGRIKVASIMMYFSAWGMGYSEIESRTTDEVVSSYAGYTAKAGEENACVSANFYKGIKSEEVTISGKVTLNGRDSGNAPLYDYAKLYILDSDGDAVSYSVLEDENTDGRTFRYSASVNPGEYTLKLVKNGYITRNIHINVEDSFAIPDISMHAGDTVDGNGISDGRVDIDDFIRVLRGFSQEFPKELCYAVDLNEDGLVNVSDLAMIKRSFGGKMHFAKIESFVDRDMKVFDWKVEAADGVITVKGGSDTAVENAKSHISDSYIDGEYYTGPVNLTHFEDYEIPEIRIGENKLSDYRIVIAQNDDVATSYASFIKDYIAKMSGYGLDIVYDTEEVSDFEIVVGNTARRDSSVDSIEEYHTFEENGKLYVFFGDEQSAEMASLDLCKKILGRESEGFNDGCVNVVTGASFEGKWSVLTRFGVLSDTHVGEGKNWADYNWLYSTFDNLEKVHAETPLDFIVSLGDNLDDGYQNTYARDYAKYIELFRELDICDAENPIDGRAEGKIPHYEICGNHDPVGFGIDGNELIRFMKNGLWYTENENGEKVAHIAFFTTYGGYPLYNLTYSGSTESYRSYGIANDKMVAFVEQSAKAAKEAGAQHIILYNHYGISQQIGSPMLPETGLEKVVAVCEKYGIKLYFSGHEHDNHFTQRNYGDIFNYDASMTATKHAVVEITTARAKVTVYNSKDGTVYREDIISLSDK